jgi:hypothetical protein
VSEIKGEVKRPVGIHARFSLAEAKEIVALGERDDRSACGVVHWIVRAYLRGELVQKNKRGGGK